MHRNNIENYDFDDLYKALNRYELSAIEVCRLAKNNYKIANLIIDNKQLMQKFSASQLVELGCEHRMYAEKLINNQEFIESICESSYSLMKLGKMSPKCAKTLLSYQEVINALQQHDLKKLKSYAKLIDDENESDNKFDQDKVFTDNIGIKILNNEDGFTGETALAVCAFVRHSPSLVRELIGKDYFWEKLYKSYNEHFVELMCNNKHCARYVLSRPNLYKFIAFSDLLKIEKFYNENNDHKVLSLVWKGDDYFKKSRAYDQFNLIVSTLENSNLDSEVIKELFALIMPTIDDLKNAIKSNPNIGEFILKDDNYLSLYDIPHFETLLKNHELYIKFDPNMNSRLKLNEKKIKIIYLALCSNPDLIDFIINNDSLLSEIQHFPDVINDLCMRDYRMCASLFNVEKVRMTLSGSQILKLASKYGKSFLEIIENKEVFTRLKEFARLYKENNKSNPILSKDKSDLIKTKNNDTDEYFSLGLAFSYQNTEEAEKLAEYYLYESVLLGNQVACKYYVNKFTKSQNLIINIKSKLAEFVENKYDSSILSSISFYSKRFSDQLPDLIQFFKDSISKIKTNDEIVGFYFACLETVCDEVVELNSTNYIELKQYLASVVAVFYPEDAARHLLDIPENNRKAADYFNIASYLFEAEMRKLPENLRIQHNINCDVDQAKLKSSLYLATLTHFNEACRLDRKNYGYFCDKLLSEFMNLKLDESEVFRFILRNNLHAEKENIEKLKERFLVNPDLSNLLIDFISWLLNIESLDKNYIIHYFNLKPELLENTQILKSLKKLNLPADLYLEFARISLRHNNNEPSNFTKRYFSYAGKKGDDKIKLIQSEFECNEDCKNEMKKMKDKFKTFLNLLSDELTLLREEKSKIKDPRKIKSYNEKIAIMRDLCANVSLIGGKFFREVEDGNNGVSKGIDPKFKYNLISELNKSLSPANLELLPHVGWMTRVRFKFVNFLHELFPTSKTVTAWMGSFHSKLCVIKDKSHANNVIKQAMEIFDTENIPDPRQLELERRLKKHRKLLSKQLFDENRYGIDDSMQDKNQFQIDNSIFRR